MKSRIVLSCVLIVCALLQITLVILDEFNPMMGFLNSPAAKLFLCTFGILALICAIGSIKLAKKK